MAEKYKYTGKLEHHKNVGKVGGDANASYKEMNEGYTGAVIRKETPPPLMTSESAPGFDHVNGYFRKMTGAAVAVQEALLEGNEDGAQTIFDHEIHERFMGIVNGFNLERDPFEVLTHRYWEVFQEDTAHEGLPEKIQARIRAAVWNENGIPAEYVNPRDVAVQDQFKRLDGERTSTKTREYLRNRPKNVSYIVPAHNAADSYGHVLELTRGCGDELAAHLGRATELPVVFLKRTRGILSADPRIVGEGNYREYARLSYAELRAAALGRMWAVHDGAIATLQKMDGVLLVRDYRNSDQEGTVVSRDRRVMDDEMARIVSGAIGGQTVRVIRRGGSPDDDFGNRVTTALLRHRVPIDYLVADGSGAVVLTKKDAFPKAEKQKIRKEVGADSIELDDAGALICVSGLGLQINRWEVGERLNRVFRQMRINPRNAEEHSTGHGIAMNFLIRPKSEDEFNEAIRRLHQELVLTNATG